MDLRNDLTYWQVIDLPDGTTTPGKADHRAHPAYLNIDDPNLLQGKRVLDVAANDGFWSFWAERQGAADVLATDVERLEDYDWGYAGPPPGTNRDGRSDAVFQYLHGLFDSKVRREVRSVYDHAPETIGQFDLVLCYGLIYHLRHPLLAIDALRRVCKGACIIETHSLLSSYDVPMMAFYEDNVLHGATSNWCGPTPACMTHWMKSAGLNWIFIPRHLAGDRQLFIGAVTEEWLSVFIECPNLRPCDAGYWRGAHATLKSATEPGSHLNVSLYKEPLTDAQKLQETPSKLLSRLYRSILGREADERAIENFAPQLEKGVSEAWIRYVVVLGKESREKLLAIAREKNDRVRLAQFCADTLAELGVSRDKLQALAPELLQRDEDASASMPPPADVPTRIEFGCGNAPREGFAGVDIRPGDNVAYVCNAWEITQHVPAGTVKEVYSHYFFEHLTFAQGEATLRAWYTILERGAVVHMELPDLRYHVEQYLNPDGRSTVDPAWSNREHAMAGFFGWQREAMTTDWDVHKSGYDFESLRAALEATGFTEVTRLEEETWQLNVRAIKPLPDVG